MLTPDEKLCTKCGMMLPITSFSIMRKRHKGRPSKDGHQIWCKTCMLEAWKRWDARYPLKRGTVIKRGTDETM